MNLKEFQEIVRENEGKIKIYAIEQIYPDDLNGKNFMLEINGKKISDRDIPEEVVDLLIDADRDNNFEGIENEILNLNSYKKDENERDVSHVPMIHLDEKELKENRIITAIEELERVDSLLKGCKYYPKAKKSLYDLLHEVRGY